jgi:hypothetical protein
MSSRKTLEHLLSEAQPSQRVRDIIGEVLFVRPERIAFGSVFVMMLESGDIEDWGGEGLVSPTRLRGDAAKVFDLLFYAGLNPSASSTLDKHKRDVPAIFFPLNDWRK